MGKILSFFRNHIPHWSFLTVILCSMVILHHTGIFLTKQAATDRVAGIEELEFQNQLLLDAKDLVKKHPYLAPRLDEAINKNACLCLNAEKIAGLQTYVQAYEAGRLAGRAGQ